MGDPVRQYACLTGTRTGNDHDRTIGVGDRRPLGLIQFIEIMLHPNSETGRKIQAPPPGREFRTSCNPLEIEIFAKIREYSRSGAGSFQQSHQGSISVILLKQKGQNLGNPGRKSFLCRPFKRVSGEYASAWVGGKDPINHQN